MCLLGSGATCVARPSVACASKLAVTRWRARAKMGAASDAGARKCTRRARPSFSIPLCRPPSPPPPLLPTFVLHAPLELDDDRLAGEVGEEGLGVDGDGLRRTKGGAGSASDFRGRAVPLSRSPLAPHARARTAAMAAGEETTGRRRDDHTPCQEKEEKNTQTAVVCSLFFWSFQNPNLLTACGPRLARNKNNERKKNTLSAPSLFCVAKPQPFHRALSTLARLRAAASTASRSSAPGATS